MDEVLHHHEALPRAVSVGSAEGPAVHEREVVDAVCEAAVGAGDEARDVDVGDEEAREVARRHHHGGVAHLDERQALEALVVGVPQKRHGEAALDAGDGDRDEHDVVGEDPTVVDGVERRHGV